MTEPTNWSWQTQVRIRIFGFVKSGDLPATQAFIILRLMEYANWGDGREAHPGIDRLATDARVTERTVSRALRFAKEFGLIEETFHGGGSGDSAKASEFRFLAATLTPADEPRKPVGRSWPITPPLVGESADEPLGVSADATADSTDDATDEGTAVPPSGPSNRSKPDSTDTEASASLLSTEEGEAEEGLPTAAAVSGSQTEEEDISIPPRQRRSDAVDDSRRPTVTLSELRQRIQQSRDRFQQRWGGDEEPEEDEDDN